jgi:hypothetical protein
VVIGFKKRSLWGSAGGSVDKESAAISDTGTNLVSLKRIELEFVGPTVFRSHFVKFLSLEL